MSYTWILVSVAVLTVLWIAPPWLVLKLLSREESKPATPGHLELPDPPNVLLKLYPSWISKNELIPGVGGFFTLVPMILAYRLESPLIAIPGIIGGLATYLSWQKTATAVLWVTDTHVIHDTGIHAGDAFRFHTMKSLRSCIMNLATGSQNTLATSPS